MADLEPPSLRKVEESLEIEVAALDSQIRDTPHHYIPALAVVASLHQAKAIIVAKLADVRMERAIRGI